MNGVAVAVIVTCVILVVAILVDMHDRKHPKNVSGFIIIDKNDPDGPYMFLELGEDVDILCERDVAMLGVIVRDPQD